MLTLFPSMFESPFAESMVRRAIDNQLIDLKVHNLRQWAVNKHGQVDDRPFGGGPGMVLMVEPIDKAIGEIKSEVDSGSNCKTVLLSPKGRVYSQAKVRDFAQLNQLILVCGHYEGVDHRVAEHLVDEVISIGDYVLTGGEIPAMAVIDSVVRLVPGVLGHEESAVDESHKIPGYIEYPHFTRPAVYKGWKVPKVLLSGDHAKIDQWREKVSKNKRVD